VKVPRSSFCRSALSFAAVLRPAAYARQHRGDDDAVQGGHGQRREGQRADQPGQREGHDEDCRQFEPDGHDRADEHVAHRLELSELGDLRADRQRGGHLQRHRDEPLKDARRDQELQAPGDLRDRPRLDAPERDLDRHGAADARQQRGERVIGAGGDNLVVDRHDRQRAGQRDQVDQHGQPEQEPHRAEETAGEPGQETAFGGGGLLHGALHRREDQDLSANGGDRAFIDRAARAAHAEGPALAAEQDRYGAVRLDQNRRQGAGLQPAGAESPGRRAPAESGERMRHVDHAEIGLVVGHRLGEIPHAAIPADAFEHCDQSLGRRRCQRAAREGALLRALDDAIEHVFARRVAGAESCRAPAHQAAPAAIGSTEGSERSTRGSSTRP
jgi:hypothetical protein